MTQILPNYLIISKDASLELNRIISRLNPDHVAILVDENSKKFCLPAVKTEAHVLEIKSGEEYKTLQTCDLIWNQLTEWGFSRNSLLINLGGGVIGDMGGFAAATYKRGMRFINIPTTLLSQVDASIGGKLGVDFGGLKNHIGVFREPDAVLVDPGFLKTLPSKELKSGFSEVIKHALIRSPEQWDYLKKTAFEDIDWDRLIPKSIAIKHQVVTEDPYESGVRKILNYGHTIGHAIESFFLPTHSKKLHGEAIAEGMILENILSERLGLLSPAERQEINDFIRSAYPIASEIPAYENLQETLKQDKKNKASEINFSLLAEIGKCKFDVCVETALLRELLK